jgi:adenylylsulfate reductase subunit A
MRVGAELSMMENRFTPARFKDGYGPVGAWFLLFKAKTLNGLGENFAGQRRCQSRAGKICTLRNRSHHPDLSA